MDQKSPMLFAIHNRSRHGIGLGRWGRYLSLMRNDFHCYNLGIVKWYKMYTHFYDPKMHVNWSSLCRQTRPFRLKLVCQLGTGPHSRSTGNHLNAAKLCSPWCLCNEMLSDGNVVVVKLSTFTNAHFSKEWLLQDRRIDHQNMYKIHECMDYI